MPSYFRFPKSAWMIRFVLFSVLLAGAHASAQQHDGPSCKKVPDLNWPGKTVQDVTLDANTKWGTGMWQVVVVRDPNHVKNLFVKAQHPAPGKGLTAGEFMHLYVDGSDEYMDTTAEKLTLIFCVLVILFSWWHILRK